MHSNIFRRLRKPKKEEDNRPLLSPSPTPTNRSNSDAQNARAQISRPQSAMNTPQIVEQRLHRADQATGQMASVSTRLPNLRELSLWPQPLHVAKLGAEQTRQTTNDASNGQGANISPGEYRLERVTLPNGQVIQRTTLPNGQVTERIVPRDQGSQRGLVSQIDERTDSGLATPSSVTSTLTPSSQFPERNISMHPPPCPRNEESC